MLRFHLAKLYKITENEFGEFYLIYEREMIARLVLDRCLGVESTEEDLRYCAYNHLPDGRIIFTYKNEPLTEFLPPEYEFSTTEGKVEYRQKYRLLKSLEK